VVPADLPAIGPGELRLVLAAAGSRLAVARAAGAPAVALVVLVPDRGGEGTNLLLLSPPGAIPFRFGLGSRAAHAVAATTRGATYLEVAGPLDRDLDTPDDLLAAEAAGLGRPAVDEP
jgi:2-phospho-L-lactate guanylyltransferase